MGEGSYTLHGLKIDDATLPGAVEVIASLATSGQPKLVVTPNSDHFLRWQKSAHFRSLYSMASLVIPDGFPLVLMARFEGRSHVKRVTGIDMFLHSMRKAAELEIPVAIIGGNEGVAEKAAANLSRDIPGLRFFLLDSPVPNQLDDAAYLEELSMRLAQEPNKIVALCLGSPKQEQLFRSLSEKGACTGCYLGVGAAVDFAAGVVRRAPQGMQDAGFEWLYRLVQEPKRLWRRYLLDDTAIFRFVVKSAVLGLRSLASPPTALLSLSALAIDAPRTYRPPARSPKEASDSVARILQVGPDTASQGGMASVISEYMTFSNDAFAISSYATWVPGLRFRSFGKAAFLCLEIMAGKHHHEIFHVHLSEFGSFVREGAIVLLARWKGRPVYVSLHGADFDRSLERYPKLTRTILSRASGIICLGPKQRALVAGLVPDVPTHVVPNPSGPKTHMWPEGKNTALSLRHFVFAGDVGTRKGFDIIADVWPDLAARYPDVRLHVCGPTTDLSAPYSLPQCVYHGTVSREEVAELLVAAEALLLPSRREVLPMSVLEALRLGTPVVASHAGELDSLAASNAIVFCDLNRQSLQSAMVSILESTPSKKESMGKAAILWSAANTSNEQIARRLQTIYSGI